MTSSGLFLLTVSVLNLAIGVWVLRHNLRRPQNSAFAFLAACVAVWVFGVAMASNGTANLQLFVRLSFSAGALVPAGLLLILEAFPDRQRILLNLKTAIVPVSALSFAVLSYSPLLVIGARFENGELRIAYGPLHVVFALYMVVALLVVTRAMLNIYRRSNGAERQQAKYLGIGLLVPAALAVSTNVLVPLMFGTTRLSHYGPAASLLMLAVIGHAIIRHRLLNVRLILRRGAIYLMAFALAGGILAAMMVSVSALTRDPRGISLLEVVLALTTAVIFVPLKNAIQRSFDRYLCRESYDYQRTVREVSRDLGRSIELSEILGCVTRALVRALRPEVLAIYVREPDEVQLELAFAQGLPDPAQCISESSRLLDVLQRERRSLFRDELRSIADNVERLNLITEMDSLRAEVIVPLLEGDELIGLLSVGAKASGDIFYSDDEDLLATLANQSAVAVHNAQTHQQVVRASEHMQEILGTIESGVVAIGRKGQITLANPAAQRLLGTAGNPLQGRPAEHLPAPLGEQLAATRQDGQSRSQVELRLPAASGLPVPIMCSTAPLRHSARGAMGAVAVFTDLTRLKELEAEKRRAERLASLEAIAAGLVHEIKNPLVSVKAYTQLLPARFDSPDFRESFVRAANRDIGRIIDLLDRFRTLASASSQPMAVIDIRDPLDAALDLLGAQLEGSRIRLRRVGGGLPLPVLGNASQLAQLFQNLCLNAVEAMEPGGELTVRLAELAEAGGATLLVEVSDTGCGIPDDLIAIIFDPFVSSKSRGSGLGLAICRSIADAHHATLWARNHTGRPGATFTLEFPAASGRPAPVPT